MRVAVIAVAVVVLAWLGVMERAARLQASGVEALARQDLAGAEADFHRARLLNPDSAPDLSRAFVLALSSRQRQAVALLEEILRREPDNRSAWGVLERITRERDPATARRAQAALQRLDSRYVAPG